MTKLALVFNGLVMTMLGARGLFTPDAFLAQWDVELSSATAFAEARSIHGGGFSALAILVWLGLFRADFRLTGLRVACFVMLGLAAGRIVGVLANGATDSGTFVAVAGEILLGGLAWAALSRDRSIQAASD